MADTIAEGTGAFWKAECAFCVVCPAGRTHLGMRVPYTEPGGKAYSPLSPGEKFTI